mmetsp:Transcript_97100/g.271785  ORF Transcript_97100/g.271785 Transcript_97100/m.271785 type:complete len:183 (-) Transcript_97100:55-603(-)
MLSDAADTAKDALQELRGVKIEQGPTVLRFLAFFAGFASLGCAAFLVINPKNALAHPVMYMLYGYISVFAATTMLFEAKHEWVEKVAALDKYQNMLMRHCSFLTVMGGRGLFYLFQGTLWLSFSDSLGELLNIGAAIALAFVGLLHLVAHWGIMPHHIAQKAVAAAEKVAGKDLNSNGVIGS